MHDRCKSLAGLGLAILILLQLNARVEADERMHLGAPSSDPAAREFQEAVGDRVFFSEGSAELGARAGRAIEAQAAWIIRNPSMSVTIEGYADDPGRADDNLRLSRRRADAVRLRLIEAGVPQERIHAIGYGKERAVAACASASCAAQNRRAVTVIGQPINAPTKPAPANTKRPASGAGASRH